MLGCGVDVAYPPEHIDLIAAVRASGAVVSEVVPGTQPRPIFFPRRNRIISGLVQAVVIVEAGEKSGSLITARMALEQGRDVLFSSPCGVAYAFGCEAMCQFELGKRENAGCAESLRVFVQPVLNRSGAGSRQANVKKNPDHANSSSSGDGSADGPLEVRV